MASNNYNTYNYPYQQSSAQQYPTYPTAPASNNAVQSARQYQQPSTTQGTDFMNYSGSSYGGQSGGYGATQETSWNSGSYGGNRESTSRAAEVLRNMSNTTYNTHSTSATSEAGFTSTSASHPHSSRYAADSSHSPQLQSQQTHASQATYGHSQARPRSVNTNQTQGATSRGLPPPAAVTGYQPQKAQALYNQQQQHSASPAEPQHNAAPTNSARSSITNNPTSQQSTYSYRSLPSVESSRSSIHNTSTAYAYPDPPSVAAPPVSVSGIADAYIAQNATTVDPMAVYDPWPEYQRKQESLRAQKAVSDTAYAEEQTMKEAASKAEEEKKDQQRERQEVEDKARQLKANPKPKPKKTAPAQPPIVAEEASPVPELEGPGNGLEAQIRAMMAKMREFNGKDPALLARIWEEERRAKAPKSPTVLKSPPPAPTSGPAQPTPTRTTPIANTSLKTVPRDSPSASTTKPAKPAPAQAAPMRQQTQTVPSAASGNTIWPPDKKVHLANAAVTFLKIRNPDHELQSATILSMLNSNPSYLELCEQLEKMGLQLDRAAFAKNLLNAVPDVNSASRKVPPRPAPVPVHRTQVRPAVMKKEIATPAAASPQYAPANASLADRESYPPLSANASPVPMPVPVAEMVPIKPELKLPANKEEAARKRNLSDLVDLTLLSDEDDMGPPRKKLDSEAQHSFRSPHIRLHDAATANEQIVFPNFPTASVPAPPPQASVSTPTRLPPIELRSTSYVEPLDRKKALRRNNYNPATIARDVLLACGRHPTERQLNQHLDSLRTTLQQISFESDLSTIKWDLIDPGNPPPGYFRDSLQALTEDADDEEDSDHENRETRAKSRSIGGQSASGAYARAQPLPQAINPFIKQKRRGRPPRQSLPNDLSPATPERSQSTSTMSASAPRPTAATTGTGYLAFRSTELGPDGKPLPKKKGRPVGWRKAIHGSAAIQGQPQPNGNTGVWNQHQPSQSSSLRKAQGGENEPIRIESRSPSVASRGPRYQSYQCKWRDCKAELHNLETLQKHVFKMHRKETLSNTLECLWGDCGLELANHEPMTNMTIVRHAPLSFDLQSDWQTHIQRSHFAPLSWELGDGLASGVSDAHDSEAYLSDAQGRQVTPRIVVDLERLEEVMVSPQQQASGPRGRGRPAKDTQELVARDAHDRLVMQKKRLGGPGMDRGGATLVNDKRRKGLIENDEDEEELVDAEDL